MSLGQLTANYTDSEEESEDEGNEERKAVPALIVEAKNAQNDATEKEERNTPVSGGSVPNSPPKKVNRLVSYYNEEEDEEDEDFSHNYPHDVIPEPDEILNSEPMDTGTDDDEKSTSSDLGIKLPPPPPYKCSASLQEKVTKYVNEVKQGNKDYNAIIQSRKDFRNPSIYEKLIDHLHLDELGSNYPLDMFDPHCWGKQSFYTELAKTQREEMDRLEKEKKEKAKIDIISGTKKPVEEELKKRKSRFDQAGPIPQLKPPPVSTALSTVASAPKTSIEAFGSLKKLK